jgi:hypothetical protein
VRRRRRHHTLAWRQRALVALGACRRRGCRPRRGGCNGPCAGGAALLLLALLLLLLRVLLGWQQPLPGVVGEAKRPVSRCVAERRSRPSGLPGKGDAGCRTARAPAPRAGQLLQHRRCGELVVGYLLFVVLLLQLAPLLLLAAARAPAAAGSRLRMLPPALSTCR